MPDAGYLTIGKVVKKLQQQYPDLSVSKVRYLQDEGLINPSRTPGGYRLYSQKDIRRLENILYLQKNHFMPLSVIKEQLERGDSGEPVDLPISGGDPATPEPVQVQRDDAETAGRLHPIDRMPELCGTTVSFVRELSENGIIQTKKSPHGRDLVDGRDLPLIRLCDELRRFGFGAKNLRQYVMAANRESATFESALMVFARKGGGVQMQHTEESDRQFNEAFTRMLGLTNAVRCELITRRVTEEFKNLGQ